MKKEELLKRTEEWDTDNDIDLAGILITISVAARRLANLLLESINKGGSPDESDE